MESAAVVLERKTIDSKNTHSVLKIGKTVFHLQSLFNEKYSYSEILERIVERKLQKEI